MFSQGCARRALRPVSFFFKENRDFRMFWAIKLSLDFGVFSKHSVERHSLVRINATRSRLDFKKTQIRCAAQREVCAGGVCCLPFQDFIEIDGASEDLTGQLKELNATSISYRRGQYRMVACGQGIRRKGRTELPVLGFAASFQY